MSEELLGIEWVLEPKPFRTYASTVPGHSAAERRSYGEDPSQFIDLYRPDASTNARGTVVSIHGGYWRNRYGLDLHEPISEHLARRGWAVANIEYRRVVPDGPAVWNEMSRDVLSAIALVEGIIDADRAVRPLVGLGHSAGGQLGLWAAAQPAVGFDALVALAPLCDLFLTDGLELSNHATAELFGESAWARPDLYASASPLHLLPLGIPQLIVHGRRDENVPFEMVPEYIESAQVAGDVVTLLDPHNVDHFQVIDPRHKLWRKIDAWLDEIGR